MLGAWRPELPVYCIYPQAYQDNARAFLEGFPGRVLYAVKANDEPAVLALLHQAGLRHFDCASVPEIEAVRAACPDSTCYFMTPARLRGAAADAGGRLGVRHFMVDDPGGLDLLAGEIPLAGKVVFARMAVHHVAASQDLSVKFGAPPGEIPALLGAIRARGAEAALAFNVGTGVTDPEAYRYALGLAREVLAATPFAVRLVDIGGGFPRAYPGFRVPDLAQYFAAIGTAAQGLPLAPGGEILCEPGRALAAPGLSAVVEVLLRKPGRLYLNDGMYGIFWELRFGMQARFAVRAWRRGRPLEGATEAFTLAGPTCDSTDILPGAVDLPAAIGPGDYLEFGEIGAYSLAGRTRFNGHHSDRIVTITGPGQRPPGPDQG